MMTLFLSLFSPILLASALINANSWNDAPGVYPTVGNTAVLVTDNSGGLCAKVGNFYMVGDTLTVINGCRGTFSITTTTKPGPTPLPSPSPSPSPKITPSPSPSPSLTAQIFILTDSGNQQPPQAFYVSALPPVPHTCFTDDQSYVGPQKVGTHDTESGNLAIIHTPPKAGDSSWSPTLIAAVQKCIRTRDIAYNSATSAGYLGWGSILGSSYVWDFGDPGSSFNSVPGFSAAHVYTNSGTYTIKLTITTDKGRSITGIRTVQVAPSTRKLYPINTQADFDAMVIAPGGNRTIQFKRGASFVQTKEITPGSNDWFTAYGSGADPIITTTFNSGSQHAFALSNPTTAHVQVDSVDFRVKTGSQRPFISEPAASNIVFKDIILSKGTTWTGPSVAFTLEGSGFLLQNIGAPLTSGGLPQSIGIDANFAFMTGDHGALYGNRIWVDSTDNNGEPGVRDCGTQIEGLSIYQNVIGGWFGKGSVLSLRGGHSSYVGSNTFYGGVSNVQTQCSDAFTPATSNTNILVENNTQKNNTFQVNGDGSYNVMYRNNSSVIESAPDPLGAFQNEILLSLGQDARRGPISILNNKLTLQTSTGHCCFGDFTTLTTMTGNTILPVSCQTCPKQ